MIKIVNLEANTVHKSIKFKKLSFDNEWINYQYTTQNQIVERAKDADIIIVNKLIISNEILEKLPKLKLISLMGTGYNNIDINACKKHQIALTNLQKYSTESVAEHTITLIMNLARNIPLYQQKIQDGTWSNSNCFCLMDYSSTDLFGKTLAIIGKGAIGSRVGEIAEKGFGMKVIYLSRKHDTSENMLKNDKTPFYEGLKTADFISIHCPLSKDTENLIDSYELSLLKPTAIIINVSRGNIINEEAMINALKNNKIGGLGLDVFSEEPLKQDSQLIKFLGKYNIILTPHTAWLGNIALNNLQEQLIENIESFIKHKNVRRII
ncbi:MAG: NAD(P)-dependent oxidoreductase [Succinivibrionaceae bacterium]